MDREESSQLPGGTAATSPPIPPGHPLPTTPRATAPCSTDVDVPSCVPPSSWPCAWLSSAGVQQGIEQEPTEPGSVLALPRGEPRPRPRLSASPKTFRMSLRYWPPRPTPTEGTLAAVVCGSPAGGSRPAMRRHGRAGAKKDRVRHDRRRDDGLAWTRRLAGRAANSQDRRRTVNPPRRR